MIPAIAPREPPCEALSFGHHQFNDVHVSPLADQQLQSAQESLRGIVVQVVQQTVEQDKIELPSVAGTIRAMSKR